MEILIILFIIYKILEKTNVFKNNKPIDLNKILNSNFNDKSKAKKVFSKKIFEKNSYENNAFENIQDDIKIINEYENQPNQNLKLKTNTKVETKLDKIKGDNFFEKDNDEINDKFQEIDLKTAVILREILDKPVSMRK